MWQDSIFPKVLSRMEKYVEKHASLALVNPINTDTVHDKQQQPKSCFILGLWIACIFQAWKECCNLKQADWLSWCFHVSSWKEKKMGSGGGERKEGCSSVLYFLSLFLNSPKQRAHSSWKEWLSCFGISDQRTGHSSLSIPACTAYSLHFFRE